MRHEPIINATDGTRPDPRAPGVIRLRQAARASFRAVIGEASVILRVEQGRKVIRGGWIAEVPEGAISLMPAAIPLDVENHPAVAGPYRATALLIPAGLAVPVGRSQAMCTSDSRVSEAFDRALDLLRRPTTPQAIRDHAVLEVLLWLDAAGLRLPPPGPGRFSDRVRRMLMSDLGHGWTAAEAAGALATSEATLRRRLAAEGLGLAELLVDMRMTRALGLLQGTDLPVSEVAHQVGYASPSRFALRFKARFGVSPSVIREG